MTKEEAKRRAKLYSALAEGKTIQFQNSDGPWKDIHIEGLNYLYDYNNYRIKPESKYRPFKNQEECWDEMSKHQMFGWVKRNDTGAFAHISAVFPDFILFNDYKYNYEESLDRYTFIDGVPFGIKEE